MHFVSPLRVLILAGLVALGACRETSGPELSGESSGESTTGTGETDPSGSSNTASSETGTGETQPSTGSSETDTGETTQSADESSSESGETTGADDETESSTEESGTEETGTEGTGESGEPEGPCADVCGSPDCGVCPDAAMVEGAGYRIDETEVRVEDYAEFLAVEILDDYLLPECAWKPGFGGFEPEFWVEQEAGNPDMPVTGVDWCDAETYCRWAQKRLCGTIGGGAPNYDEVDTPSDEWFQACSGGDQSVYPYGDDYEALACNGWELGVEDVVPVGTLPACEGGLEQVHDLSGNVWEWTAACAEPNPDLQDHELECRRRGGSWVTSEPELLRCAVKSKRYRAFRASNVGIRCCADP